jgi:integrase
LQDVLRYLELCDEYNLPKIIHWKQGQQAKVLKKFCYEIGLPSIKFHTLRACFPTNLISQGIEPIKVMKVCGWMDLKTMSYYIRLSGIDKAGITDRLKVLS